jgi:hypothetical protein
MENYYNKIFLEHIKATPNKTPAPKNFWPYSYQFYLCNPIKVFQSTILNSNTTPEIQIEHYIEPHIDRVGLVSEDMPSSLLNLDEWKSLLERAPESLLAENLVNTNLSEFKNLLNHKTFQKKKIILALPLIGESLRDYIPLRDTDKISTAKTQYQRR